MAGALINLNQESDKHLKTLYAMTVKIEPQILLGENLSCKYLHSYRYHHLLHWQTQFVKINTFIWKNIPLQPGGRFAYSAGVLTNIFTYMGGAYSTGSLTWQGRLFSHLRYIQEGMIKRPAKYHFIFLRWWKYILPPPH